MRPTKQPRTRAFHLTTLAAVALSLAVISCTAKQPETQTATTTTTSTVHVNRIDLGRSLSSDRRVVTTDAAFSPTDTVYAAVALEGPVPASQVTARWTSMDGQTVAETSQSITASEGEGVTQFQFAPPTDLAPGTYKLDILQDGQVVSSREFTVTAP